LPIAALQSLATVCDVEAMNKTKFALIALCFLSALCISAQELSAQF